MAEKLRADVICLQETKCPDELFPFQPFIDAGYIHNHVCGMKGYNGVAILSRLPITTPTRFCRFDKDDCRHGAVTLYSERLKKNVVLHNLYIPAGGDIPDPAVNEKFAHKLGFVDELAGWFPADHKRGDLVIALGDFNIAPLENDVWSHKQLLDVVSHTPVEVAKLTSFYASMEWVDAIRYFVPPEQKCYTWWSYRNKDWKASNRGRRLDHIWVTKPLSAYLTGHEILAETRDWEQTSDHVPVMLEIAI